MPTSHVDRCSLVCHKHSLNSGSGTHSTVRVVMQKRCTAARLLTVSARTGTRAASSWYIAKLRRAYGPQLIPADAQHKALQTSKGKLSCLLHSQKPRRLAFAAELGY